MSAEWVTAIATAGTFAVIAASAAAALIQLRHMRGSNQIVALTECRETLESPEFTKARNFVVYELSQRLADPQRWREVLELPFAGEYNAIPTVANFFETMGLFVKHGIIDRRIACDAWAGVVALNWQSLLPVVTYLRKDIGSSLWENFEYLAAVSDAHMKQAERVSDYPRNVPRMSEDRSLIERAAGSDRSAS